MPISLTEAAKLSNDTLQRGVISTFAQSSPVMEMLPFMEIAGNSYQYNVEETLPEVGFRSLNNSYPESSGTVGQQSESLTMLGGDVDVDRFVAQTLGNINNQRAIQTNMKVKSLSKTFTKQFFKGDVSTEQNGFNGLDVRLSGTGQDLDNETSKLTLNVLHELLDGVEGGADALFMSKAMRRELQKLLEGQQHYVQVGKDKFGRPVEYFGDVQIRTVEDNILPFTDDTADSTDNATSDIYAVKFGAQEFVSGLTNGGVDVRDIGELDSLPVYRTRIEFYCGIASFNPKGAARLKNIVRG